MVNYSVRKLLSYTLILNLAVLLPFKHKFLTICTQVYFFPLSFCFLYCIFFNFITITQNNFGYVMNIGTEPVENFLGINDGRKITASVL